jgi:hypothetical protein
MLERLRLFTGCGMGIIRVMLKQIRSHASGSSRSSATT